MFLSQAGENILELCQYSSQSFQRILQYPEDSRVLSKNKMARN